MVVKENLDKKNAKPSAYYFYVKTKMSVDFHICIIVPLNSSLAFIPNKWFIKEILWIIVGE